MQTKVTMINGKKHIIDGRPEDLMQLVRGIGVMQRDLVVTSVKGRKVNMEEVAMMQLVERDK